MKLIQIRKVSLLLIFSFLFVYGCDIINPIEGIRAILNTKERTTTITLIFIDVESEQPIGALNSDQVKVTISGRDMDSVIDLMNRPATTFQTDKGFVSFAIRDEIMPDKERPVEFRIHAAGENYLPVTKLVKLNSTRGNPYEIAMVPVKGYPMGAMGDVVSAGRMSDGATEEGVRFMTPIEPITGTRSEVLIPAGTNIKTLNGTSLNGNLSASFVHFSNATSPSLRSFPGGLSSLYSDPNGDQKEGFFNPAVFIHLVIADEAGLVARRFSNDIIVSMETTELNAKGEMDIWSLSNENGGVWDYEMSTNLEYVDSDKLVAEFVTNHLSWWTAGNVHEICGEGSRVHFTNSNIRLRGELFRTSDDTFIGGFQSKSAPENATYESYIDLGDMPVATAAYMKLYNIFDELVKIVQIPELCGSVTVVDLGFLETITVRFEGTGICENLDDKEVRPSFPAWYKPEVGGSWISAGDVVNGVLVITLPEVDNYLFGSYYDDEFVTHMLDLNEAEDGDVYKRTITVPEEYCEGF